MFHFLVFPVHSFVAVYIGGVYKRVIHTIIYIYIYTSPMRPCSSMHDSQGSSMITGVLLLWMSRPFACCSFVYKPVLVTPDAACRQLLDVRWSMNQAWGRRLLISASRSSFNACLRAGYPVLLL